MVTIRVYNLRTEKQKQEFTDIYDELYKNDLIEFQNSVKTRQELVLQMNYLYLLYGGMTIRVIKDGNLIYGGLLYYNTIDYILDELDKI